MSNTSAVIYQIRLVNGELWGEEGGKPDEHHSLVAAIGTAEDFVQEAREEGLDYDVDDIELVIVGGGVISLSDAIDQLARESDDSLDVVVEQWRAQRAVAQSQGKSNTNALCQDCPQFEQHAPNLGRNEHNCDTWLTNCGDCPHDAELAEANPTVGSMLQGFCVAKQ